MADGAHTQAYTFDPYQNLTGSQQHLVLGGEPTYCPVFVYTPDSKHCFVCVTPRRTSPLDRTIWPSKSRRHRLASRCCLRGSLLVIPNLEHVDEWYRSE